MTIRFHALPTSQVIRIRETVLDAYDNPVETHISNGQAYPCRHCLGMVPKGRSYLVLAHRPFDTTNPYAETGPIFLCADKCSAFVPGAELPAALDSPNYIVRGYSADERILYGTGKVTPTSDIAAYADELFADPKIAFVDIRSATNNCFQCRVLRA